jgi:hypothetical protein
MTSSPHLPIVPFKLDFAVCSKNYSAINLRNNNDHVIELDNISISESLFKSIFYQTDNFSINPGAALQPSTLIFISFINQTVLGVKFCLVDEIYKNIENDLGISRILFSPCTNIALNKQLGSIKSLCDIINSGTILCSMNWSEIVNSVRCEFDNVDPINTNPTVVLTLSVVFTTPTTGVNATIIKFNFLTSVNIIEREQSGTNGGGFGGGLGLP